MDTTDIEVTWNTQWEVSPVVLCIPFSPNSCWATFASFDSFPADKELVGEP